MRYVIAAVMALCVFGPAQADTYTYKCKAGGKTLSLVADDANNVILWRGKTYNLTEDQDCAKFGWHAVAPGSKFDFCTATQGYADFDENGKGVQCQQTEMNGAPIKNE